MNDENKSKHIRDLAEELLDDIELDRISDEKLVLKTIRLARYTGSTEIKQWLSLEIKGYTLNKVGKKYMSKTGRWTDKENNKGYWISLPRIEATINTYKLQLQSMNVPNTSGDLSLLTVKNVTSRMTGLSNAISELSGVRSAVIGLIHEFVTNVYYDKVFEHLSESIFESYKNEIDELIADKCGTVIERIPSVIERLSSGDEESISHALTTCRRIIDSFADSILPASDDTYDIGGNKLSLKKDKVQNRINVYIHQRCESKSRRKKLRDSLSNLYDRVSTGVHNDVGSAEAKSLFLNTYLLLGEILTLE